MYRKKFLRTGAFLLSAVLMSANLSACGGKDKNSQDSTAPNQAGQTQPKEPVKLKYWTPVHVSSVKIVKNFAENEAYKEVMKRTGVEIEFLHPAIGQEKEQFQLMIASNNLPDLIQHSNGVSYVGGADKAISDGMYLKLNDLIDKYAPNYKKLREENKEIAKLTITDAGNIWGFARVSTEDESAWRGPVLRKDFLDELGLGIPTTIEEWDTTLRAFKQKGIEAPLLFPKKGITPESQFTSAFGIGNEFYLENGKVKYGPVEKGYKDYLTLINKWYKDGLVDKDFATRDSNALDSLVMSNKAGAWIGAPDVYINAYLTLKKDDPKFKLTGAPYPSLKKGENVKIAQKTWMAGGYEVAVTKDCKDPETAVKFMDFHYSDEGYLLFNYGIENVSYKMVDNKPVFTDLMLNNPDNLTYDVLAWKYKLHAGAYLRNYLACPPFGEVEKEARDMWSKASIEGVMPSVTHTSEENKKISSTMGDLNTYREEMIMKFILGVEPLSKFDEFVSQLKNRGIDEIIKIKQDALDRYNAR